ncbi:binding-protein-dependent transport systems inner membrane component [Caldicellulosiruptor acetigenus I77R1B]|jgi:raffinose/stachyose/melibiose transport system permease protein|uniref:Binding-protein-dependent transport systems inner membrane component n=1 Tax=Caldicellulosiruptor acetigenus (strain ATCC 700853 / DSM 12137 / I77R1B) TaxID=632335 RepID=E4S707_CALA7|nr:sugar ABC transporter permease [Caldicellulosiruptor acetigenus]ADQ39782.1 binding-protein-dependent transport systems inner membrane component [Caldicellulosiruptor acetigenus I77R1B]
MERGLFKPKSRVFIGYLALPVAWYVFVVVMPLILALRYSLYDWSGGPRMRFVGLSNYAELIKDTDFWLSFKNNVIITLLCIVGQIGIAFVLAALMTTRVLKFKEFHRTVIFLPVVLSAVVIGFIWTLMYNQQIGILNWVLRAIGLESLIKPWLDDPKIVIYSVSVPLIWQYIGFYLVILMASLQSIPKEIFEAAEIDGADGFKRTIYIILPLLADTLKVSVMLCIAGNMKVFDHIYVMTGGGPGKSSMVMAQYAYNNSFIMFKLGYGSTISVGILILSLAIILLSRKLMGGKTQ